MKYNTLLVGSNSMAIDEFFVSMKNKFNCMSSSNRSTDIDKHINLFKPQLLIACIRDEELELARVIYQNKDEIAKNDITVVVLGDKQYLDSFLEQIVDMVDIVLERPLTNLAIINKIDEFMLEKERAKMNMEMMAKQQEIRQAEQQAKRQAEQIDDTKKRILIVDDDPNVLKLVKGHLEPNYTVATAISGSIALKFLSNKEVDLILLDYEMPGQDGDSVLRIIRGSSTTKEIPVIFLTGVTDSAKIAKAISLNPQGYILKPIVRSKLLAEISKVLGE